MSKVNVSKIKQHVAHAAVVAIGAISPELLRVGVNLLHLPLGKNKTEETEPIINETNEQIEEQEIAVGTDENETHIHDACDHNDLHYFI